MQTGGNVPQPDPDSEPALPQADVPEREGSGEGANTALARLIEQEKARQERRSGGEEPADEPSRPSP